MVTNRKLHMKEMVTIHRLCLAPSSITMGVKRRRIIEKARKFAGGGLERAGVVGGQISSSSKRSSAVNDAAPKTTSAASSSALPSSVKQTSASSVESLDIMR